MAYPLPEQPGSPPHAHISGGLSTAIWACSSGQQTAGAVYCLDDCPAKRKPRQAAASAPVRGPDAQLLQSGLRHLLLGRRAGAGNGRHLGSCVQGLLHKVLRPCMQPNQVSSPNREPSHCVSCVASTIERGLACDRSLPQEPLLGLMKCRHCCGEAAAALQGL